MTADEWQLRRTTSTAYVTPTAHSFTSAAPSSEGPFDRTEALARETVAVVVERPRFNVPCTTRRPNVGRAPPTARSFYVKNRVCLSGRDVMRAFWTGALPLRPTAADLRAWVQTLDIRYHASPCPFEPDCRCCTEDPEADYATWAEAQPA